MFGVFFHQKKKKEKEKEQNRTINTVLKLLFKCLKNERKKREEKENFN